MDQGIKGQADIQLRARKYSNIKYILALVDLALLLAILFCFQYSGFSKIIALNVKKVCAQSIFIIPAYLLAAYIAYYLLNFPVNFYQSFVLEHKFCLTKQKFAHWLMDQAKSSMIFYIIIIIFFEAFYFILKISPHFWWLIVSLLWIFFNLILARIAPVIIIPLFFKYKKLSDETLRQRILNLASKTKVKILDVFEIDFSKKTLKANAAFVGWGKSRRVILADTLKDKYSYDEIEVILAHEFAHYKLKHLIKLIFLNSTATILALYFIYRTSGFVLNLFGYQALSDIAALPLILIYFVIFGIILDPLSNYISRCMERNADKAALRITGLKDAFISMMDKLANQNLADRKPHPLIKLFFFDHPPIDERIKMAENYPTK
ncbi:MAG: M48 family metallopeptidase [Candidatus Omnitrophota bacterium]